MQTEAHPITLDRNDAEDAWLLALYALRVAEHRGQTASHLRRIEQKLAGALFPSEAAA